MNNKKIRLLLLILVVSLLVSTVAYAYVRPEVTSTIPNHGTVGGDVGKGTSPSNPQTLPPASDQSLEAILTEKGIPKLIPDFNIVVDKTDHRLTLYSGATPLKSYNVALSEVGLGDKVKAGDHLTPEGSFRVVEKYALSPADQFIGSRWMRLSYPNNEDALRGLNTGLIDQATYDSIVNANDNGQKPPQNTALGGGIGIHGGRDTNDLSKDWTWGCTGLFNKDVEEFFKYVTVGTPVTIQY